MNLYFNIKLVSICCLFFFYFMPQGMQAQTLPSSFPTNVEDLSDSEILGYWQQAKDQGYTIAQIKALAQARGVSPSQIQKLERRLNSLGSENSSLEGTQIDSSLGINEDEPSGLTGYEINIDTAKTKDPLFGYTFFNNENITFAPNLNLATPSNYELGPGDELVISIWGAAENTYETEVDREGAVRIQNIGPIYVSGLPISEAKSKIKGALRRIYAGITASDSSPYKVFVSVSLTNVRTVQVNIIGEVKVPGTYSLSALSTVLNALYASGGPTKQGTFRNIKLVRNGNEVSTFDIYKYLIEGSQEGNKTLKDQDVLIVSPYISRVTVKGNVKRPGIYELKSEETLEDLLDYVSGFNSNAYRERVILERIEGDRRRVKEILMVNAGQASLQDGDSVIVTEIIDKFENRINIEGAVYRPGAYEYIDGLTLSELINKASGIKEEAFLDRGLILSTQDGVRQSVESFSVEDVVTGIIDYNLKPNDVVRIYNKYNLKEATSLSINGAVNEPDSFPYIENMTVQDLVIMAGGFKDGANVNVIDVFRRIKDDVFETLSINFKVSAEGGLTLEDGTQFKLQPNDKVSVRYLKGYSEQKTVSIMGEINYPGNYVIENKNERISDLVEKAGGLSPYAFVDGASLIRLNPYYKQDSQEIAIVELNQKDSVVDSSLKNRKEFRVGIDLAEILLDGGDSLKNNLILQDGDRLVIPSMRETVKVEGEVLVPSLVRFDKSHTLKDYINKSGGFSSNAKAGKSYVIYANGDIASTKRFLFFRSYPKLKPGAIILVPEKPADRNKLSAQEVVGISTGLTTLGLLIDRLLQ